MNIDDIRSSLVEPAQILQYAVLKDNIIIWVVAKDKFFTASTSVPVGDLQKKVTAFNDLISRCSERDLETFYAESDSLYQLLISPVEAAVDPNRPLCIVPDKILNYLPFAALRPQSTGEYLIERQQFGFVLSPSSSLFVICSNAARKLESSKPESSACVGDPLFDRKLHHFDRLQAADREARAVAECYGSHCPLIGASATKRRVMEQMEAADVIHLATHAFTDEWNPLRSTLLLAKDPSGKDADGTLRATDIYKMNLPRAKLVVLSACRSGVEKYYGGEGMVGLARPFIAKRIPLVVGSLWPVNSESTADLMIAFHEFRKCGNKPTSEALRAAQIQMIQDAGSVKHLPYHWASFVTIGGYAEF